MNLVVNTSTENLKVLLFENEKILAKNSQEKVKTLANLLPQIDFVLSQSNLKLKEIKNFFVVLGPGSFTGIRIGVSTIKAFLNVFKFAKCLGINMLDFLAFKITSEQKPKTNFAILVKSTSTKYYVGLYDFSGKNIEFSHIQKDILEEYVLKNNCKLFSFETKEKNSEQVNFSDEDLISYCRHLLKKKAFLSETDLKPVYLALSQAEEELLKKEKADAGN